MYEFLHHPWPNATNHILIYCPSIALCSYIAIQVTNYKSGLSIFITNIRRTVRLRSPPSSVFSLHINTQLVNNILIDNSDVSMSSCSLSSEASIKYNVHQKVVYMIYFQNLCSIKVLKFHSINVKNANQRMISLGHFLL